MADHRTDRDVEPGAEGGETAEDLVALAVVGFVNVTSIMFGC